MSGSPWFLSQPHPAHLATKSRLFCLPYAGGGASIYRQWSRYLSPQIEVCPIQLPGRENRFRERPYTRIEPLVKDLIYELRPYLYQPYQIFGHSMGALIAFTLARELRRQALPLPTQLFLSARPAPQLPSERAIMHTQPHDEFINSIKKLGGTPNEVLQNKELMDLLIPTLRADFAIVETFTYQDEPPLAIPITIFGGSDDDEIPAAKLAAWEAQTSSAFRLKIFPGDHFFLHIQQKFLLQAIAQE
jgi:Predicted thioesterase involved in non-ribosomal peptide biosynthesis